MDSALVVTKGVKSNYFGADLMNIKTYTIRCRFFIFMLVILF